MIEFIAICLLTLALIGCIFLASLVRLWRNPPVISVDIVMSIPELAVPIQVPENVKIQVQKVLPVQETDKPVDEPIPEDIVIYCEQESDSWAQDARKKRARMLKRELGSWDAAFRALQREDSIDV